MPYRAVFRNRLVFVAHSNDWWEEMELSRWMILGYISLVMFFIGIFLVLAFLFWIPSLGFLGISFLIFFIVVVALVRRKTSIVKRSNPEVIEALRAQSSKNREKEKTLGIKDVPPWLVVSLLVIIIVSYLGWYGAFGSNPLLETLLSVLIVVLLIYYFLYKRKIINKKYRANSIDSPNTLNLAQYKLSKKNRKTICC
jgi:4-hydroxybenzoate polyprenyltransferase